MSEEKKNIEATETEATETASTQEPTVKVAEMKRRLEKEQEKYQQQIDELKANQEDAIQKAYEKAQAEAKMSADELAEYKQKEAERKHQEEIEKRDKQIAELTKVQRQREIKDESINKLSELNIAVNDRTLSLVSAESLDGMAERAEMLAKVISEVKNEYAGSEPPRTSGGSVAKAHDDPFDILDKAKLT